MDKKSILDIALKNFSISAQLFDVATKEQIKIITDEKVKESKKPHMIASQTLLLKSKNSGKNVHFNDIIEIEDSDSSTKSYDHNEIAKIIKCSKDMDIRKQIFKGRKPKQIKVNLSEYDVPISGLLDMSYDI
jgi:C1A family cysteine protease